jgi:hypothetical protein
MTQAQRLASRFTKQWWLPILIPAILIPTLVIDTGRKGTHVVHSTYGSAVVGWVAICLFLGATAFFAGRRYERSKSN